MKYIQLFDSYKIVHDIKLKDGHEYYFNTEKHQYKVSFLKYSDTNYYSLGFRAKGDNEFFYDMAKITNENRFEVMQTIIDICMKFYNEKSKEIYDAAEKYNININIKDFFSGFVFSFTGDEKKSRQRLILYKRYIPIDWNLEFKNNIYYLTKQF